MQDPLWRPWLARDFEIGRWRAEEVDTPALHWAAWGPTPARQYNALAVVRACPVCQECRTEGHEEERELGTRYRGPHSCKRCGLLHCARHYCSCNCLAGEMCLHLGDDHLNYDQMEGPCSFCKGRAHTGCDRIEVRRLIPQNEGPGLYYTCTECRRFIHTIRLGPVHEDDEGRNATCCCPCM